jgi:hydrogenase nickel incorporation protein HypA/HybF
MHEFSIAAALAEKVTAFAAERSPIRVLRVRLAVGELTCIQTEQLCFCYGAIIPDSIIRDSVLEIEPVAPVVSCPSCGYTGAPKYWDEAQWHTRVPTLACPQCGGTTEAIEGNECSIRTIQYAN